MLLASHSRFIPTRVGNTENFMEWCGDIAVHPHACGEYCTASEAIGNPAGSSPRVWGILGGIGVGLLLARFIPTRVGNTTFSPLSKYMPAVHPHACGEYGMPTRCLRMDSGSSPRVWGIRPTKAHVFNDGRFIPTRVGNTSAKFPPSFGSTVHPHACGEY